MHLRLSPKLCPEWETMLQKLGHDEGRGKKLRRTHTLINTRKKNEHRLPRSGTPLYWLRSQCLATENTRSHIFSIEIDHVILAAMVLAPNFYCQNCLRMILSMT